MTNLSKEQDAEPKSLLESLVTEIYLEKIDVNLFTAEIVEKNDQHFGVKTKSFYRSMVKHNWGTDTFRKM